MKSIWFYAHRSPSELPPIEFLSTCAVAKERPSPSLPRSFQTWDASTLTPQLSQSPDFHASSKASRPTPRRKLSEWLCTLWTHIFASPDHCFETSFLSIFIIQKSKSVASCEHKSKSITVHHCKIRFRTTVVHQSSSSVKILFSAVWQIRCISTDHHS